MEAVIIVILLLLLLLSIGGNLLLIWYSRNLVKTCFTASEAASEIFARFDAYRQHLTSIFQLEMFYGDRNLRDVIEHTKDMIQFLKRFNGIYSFTQPELEKVLEMEESQDAEENNPKEDATQEKEG